MNQRLHCWFRLWWWSLPAQFGYSLIYHLLPSLTLLFQFVRELILDPPARAYSIIPEPSVYLHHRCPGFSVIESVFTCDDTATADQGNISRQLRPQGLKCLQRERFDWWSGQSTNFCFVG